MLIIYLIIGAFAGIMSGLFGLGGGVIVIPALSAVFLHYTSIPREFSMQMAVGTSLAIMISTSLSALYAHHKRQAVRWDMFRLMLPGLMLGAMIGVLIVHYLPSSWLQIIFGLFLILVGLRMLFNHTYNTSETSLSLRLVRISSLLIGILSSILGVGGGTLIVPFLLRCQLDMRKATGTSIACGLSIGIVATLCFMITGFFSAQKASWSTGYIYWPAFLGVAVASTLLAPVGAILAHNLPKEILKRFFGLFLLLIACDMLFFK
ncbi:MAG TPA: sulfite exporter TauE/SafE family protein [Gammaproteobacteria bacterium]|nr:sulfite exporter TauE/SafE family protein [Gammaproteobacteria bacterium]